jgi:hypothetical protein
MLEKSFIDLDLGYQGGESSRKAMNRAVASFMMYSNPSKKILLAHMDAIILDGWRDNT